MTDPLLLRGAPELRLVEIELPGTKRPAAIHVPADMTDAEWLALIGMLPKIRDALRAERGRSRIIGADTRPEILRRS